MKIRYLVKNLQINFSNMQKEKIANYHIAKEVKRLLKELYGKRLDKILLYGSYARGEQTENSDMDFMVVLNKKKINVYDEISISTDKKLDLSIENALRISLHPVTKTLFTQSKEPFFNNVRKDALQLWLKALRCAKIL